MYDRKKITLFILLIATVILGGVSLYLATQINQSQAPDDSLAGTGICSQKYGIGNCSSIDNKAACQQEGYTGYYPECCSFTSTGSSGICVNKAGTRPGYCSLVSCSQATITNGVCDGFPDVQNVCTWTEIQTTCSATTGDSTCHGRLPGAACQLPGGTNGKCNGTAGNACSCQAVSTGGGTDNCTQGGQTITHGATSCIDGSNYSCNNGTVTQGGSCGTTTPDPDPGQTGSTCTITSPTKAKLTSPGNEAVLITTTATLTWDRNGTFGVGCPENTNQFRIRVAEVALGAACPTDTSNSGPYTRVGAVDGGPNGTFNLTVEDGKKYCWLVRKNNGDKSTDSGVRSFTVDIEEVVVDPGVDEDVTPGGEEIVDEEVVELTTTGAVLSASGSGSLPATAILSDELDPLILGMILVIIGLTLYKFDFGRKRMEV